MDIPLCWPESVVPVQSLTERGITSIPKQYVKPLSERPPSDILKCQSRARIPVINLGTLDRSQTEREFTLRQLSSACKEWGFFQVLNHGVSPNLVKRMREVWREFFRLPTAIKKAYANNPETYEGYGSRVGVMKGAILDWGDYFFLSYQPKSSRNTSRWPAFPPTCKGTTGEYGRSLVELSERLMKAISVSSGLDEERLQEAAGGKDGIEATLRVNLYPRCPEPQLTLGLSPHSDPGLLTILLPDERVKGLQVMHNGEWITIQPVPGSFVINIGDQIQVLTNGLYKSSEHRVVVNAEHDRYSFAFFYNPRGDLALGPLPEFVNREKPPRYASRTFTEYRKFIRTLGPQGKRQIESTKAQ
ncbi:jasmonate-induced oxygenase 4-like [Wolffia australiana]